MCFSTRGSSKWIPQLSALTHLAVANTCKLPITRKNSSPIVGRLGPAIVAPVSDISCIIVDCERLTVVNTAGVPDSERLSLRRPPPERFPKPDISGPHYPEGPTKFYLSPPG